MSSGPNAPSNQKPAKTKKKNGFYIFMEEQKASMERSYGRKIPMSELTQLLGKSWQVCKIELVLGWDTL